MRRDVLEFWQTKVLTQMLNYLILMWSVEYILSGRCQWKSTFESIKCRVDSLPIISRHSRVDEKFPNHHEVPTGFCNRCGCDFQLFCEPLSRFKFEKISTLIIFSYIVQSLIMSKPLEENVIDSNHETLERHVRQVRILKRSHATCITSRLKFKQNLQQCPFGGGGGGAFGGAGAQNGIPGFPGNQNPLGGQQGFPGQQQPQQNLPFTLG